MFTTRVAGILLLIAMGSGWASAATLREPVHPRRNMEEFPPGEARFIRFTVEETNLGNPCLDELEVYAVGDETRNVALAANGGRPTASGELPGYPMHQLSGVNDGRYGNARSWIADRREGAWVQIEFPTVLTVHRVVWGRDREGKFIDRLATKYRIEVSVDTNVWRTVASSVDREPPAVGAQLLGPLPVTRQFVNRFAPVSTTLSSEAQHSPTEYTIDVWQTADGLPGNTVTAIQQTPDGYLWLATLNGLVRFDGVRFTVFGEGAGLTNIRVLCLLAQPSGALWLGTDGGGLLRFFEGRFDAFTSRRGLAHDVVMSLAAEGENRIWAGTPAGLVCWEDGKLSFDRVIAPPGQRSITGVTLGSGSNLWCVGNGALLLRRGTNLVAPPFAGDPSSFSTVFAAHFGYSGQLWFGGANGYVGAISNSAVRPYAEQAGQLLGTIWELCETRNGDVWAGTDSGGLYRLRDGKFTALTTQEGLSDNSVRSLFEDREGNLWVGTVGGGLNRIKPRNVTTFTTRDGLSHNVIMSLAEDDDGALWIGSNCGGLNVRRGQGITPYTASYVLDNECIWSLLAARDGALWIGTWGGGLFRQHRRDLERVALPSLGNDEPIIALCEDLEAGLWLGTVQAGVKYFRDGRVVSINTSNGLSANFVTTIVQESTNALWVGTSGGGLNRVELNRTSPSGIAPRSVMVLSRQDGLPSDFVRTLHQDPSGSLWIGTSGGLALWKDGRMASFTAAQGLPDVFISQIVSDHRGNLWFGCNRGIFRCALNELTAVAAGNKARLNPIVYGRSEGLEQLECTGGFHPAGLRSRDGILWFSTVKGLVKVDPERIPVNLKPPPIAIEEMWVDGVPLETPGRLTQMDLTKSAAVHPELRIGPGVQRVEFRFTALSLVAPERNRFRFRLRGLETDWAEAGGQRVAVYSHVPAGHYRFEVTACNNDGVWNETGAALAFRVLPAFWQSGWFALLVLTAIVGGGSWAVRRWTARKWRQKLEKAERRHALERERTRIAQDLHDELGASLTRIALLTELGRKHRDRPEEIAADLSRISTTAREAVRAMDAIVWAVNPQNDSLDHFANYVSQYAEEFFRPTSIRCRLDVPPDLPDRELSTEARHHLLLAVKESLNNVVRHSDATEVWVRLSSTLDKLVISIEDNGRGFAGGEGGSGHDGLVNIRNRVEGLGGRFELVGGAGCGTTIRLHLPIPERDSTEDR